MATQNKYDRQLRLWGAQGQKALGETTVILIRATAAGTETLKNLVLPGIGKIVVVDDVEDVDVGEDQVSSNFFIQPGKNRAQGTMEYLQELNPDVQASYIHCGSSSDSDTTDDDSRSQWQAEIETCLIEHQNQQNQNKNVLVIGADLEPPLSQWVSSTCETRNIPLILVQSYGLVGTVRVQTPSLPLVDPKPDTEVPDLRLLHPLPAIQTLMDNHIQWDTLDSQQHGHIPYPFLLLKAIQDWKKKKQHSNNSNRIPQTFDEKNEFRESLKQASRNIDLELNYQEAVANAYLAYTEKTLDVTHLQDLLDKTAPTGGSSNSDGSPPLSPSLRKFQIMIKALIEFMKLRDGQPPLHGTIPDMTASTDLYVQLQKAYRDQATQDVEEMKRLIDLELAAASSTSTTSTPIIRISTLDIETFCKNVFVLDIFQTRSWQEEMTESSCPDDVQEDLVMATMDPYEIPEHTPLLWYLGVRGCQLFYERQGRYPGLVEDEYEEDIAKVHDCICQIVQRYNLMDNELLKQTVLKDDDNEKMKYAQELVRYGNAEIHSIASIVGGVASQEAVKLITGQYVPLNNTYVFNGIASTGGVYKF